MVKKNPIGVIELATGSKAIYPMNDFFLNYTFENPDHWEALRLTVNILFEAYKELNPETTVKPITGEIIVETQYKYLLDINNSTRDQDIKVTDKAGINYIEFQNKSVTVPPVEIRSVEYFGLGIGHSKGKPANQVWLLAENLPSVLGNDIFARYILKNEVTNKLHPAASGILYINLEKLSQEENIAGELALFLLGGSTTIKNEAVKKIAEMFNESFKLLKADKEAMKMMTFAERYINQGRQEGKEIGEEIGKEIGEEIGAFKFFDLIKKGIDPDEALRLITGKTKEAVQNNMPVH